MNVYVIDCAHYTVDGMEEDNAGFCSPSCACGWKSPPCPDWETAVDGLMQHAYEAGILTARGPGSVTPPDQADNDAAK